MGRPRINRVLRLKGIMMGLLIDFQDGTNDFYCWICHAEGEVICCDVCPRVFHEKCMPRVKRVNQNEKEFFCPECIRIQDAENTATRIPSMRNVSSSGIFHTHLLTWPHHDPTLLVNVWWMTPRPFSNVEECGRTNPSFRCRTVSYASWYCAKSWIPRLYLPPNGPWNCSKKGLVS